MTFIEAVIGAHLAGFEICSDEREHDGKSYDVCVYDQRKPSTSSTPVSPTRFVGKLRWACEKWGAHADDELISAIKERLKELNIPVPNIVG